MRKAARGIIVAMIIAVSPVLALSDAHAQTLIVGWKGWYTFWDSAAARAMNRLTAASYGYTGTPVKIKKRIANGYLTGPVMGFQYKEWSAGVSSMFINEFYYKLGGFGYNGAYCFPILSRVKMNRWEVDTAVGYSFFNWLKLFAGYKYQNLSYNIWHLMGGEFMAIENNYDLHMPTVGVAFYWHILDNLNMGIQAGALCLVPRTHNVSITFPFFPILSEITNVKLTPAFGFNGEFAITYILMEHVIFQVGYRYQMFQMRGYTGMKRWRMPGISSMESFDMFHGVTASVSYAVTSL